MIRDEKRLASLLDTTRRFMNDVAIPNEERVERENAIPEEIVAKMRSLGFFGWSIPEDYGGAGLTTEELCLANMEISQCAVAYRARCGTNTGIGSEAIIQDGTEEQKKEVPAAPRLRRDHGMPRGDRARGRLRPARRPCDPGRGRRRPLRAERDQALHHQRADRRRVHGPGADRPVQQRRLGDHCVPHRARHAGPVGRSGTQEDGPGRLAGFRGVLQGLPRAPIRGAGGHTRTGVFAR